MADPLYPLRGGNALSRRSFLGGSASFAAAAWLSSARVRGTVAAAPKLSAYPFQLGVASGDPLPTGVVLWTRLAPRPLEAGGGMPASAVEVGWEAAEDEAMSRVVQRGTAVANPEWAHAVHVDVTGLRPDRWYWYRFQAAGEVSPVGRTRTAPPPEAIPGRLNFAFISCQDYSGGYYTAFDHLARGDFDLIVHLGDYIYETPARPGTVRQHNSGEIFSLDEYRARHAQYRSDPALQAAHQAAPWIVTWDDHDVSNNYANDIPEFPERITHDDFLRRRAAAYQAYYEHMPLRPACQPHGPDALLYRRLEYGRLASFHVLDTRQYRTDQPQGDGMKPDGPILLDPAGTLMGTRQREWFFDGLVRSPAAWNVIAQQVMMAKVDTKPGPGVLLSMDKWPGYEFERRQVLRHLHDHQIRNPVVISGDIHSNWANDLIADFDELDSQVIAPEFAGTSMSSDGDGAENPKWQGPMLAENPFVKWHNSERGYVRCTLTPETWTTAFCTVPYVSRPGAPLNTRATFLVESGRPGLNRVS